MARVGQFKALGSKLGGYKKTLAEVQSKEYAKKYADVQAQEAVSLYNEIGGTVANIIGISQEMRELKKISPLDKPDKPMVGLDESYGTMSPDALEGVDIVKGKEVSFAPDLTIDDTLQMAGPREDVMGSINPPPSEMMPRAGLDTLIQESQSKTKTSISKGEEDLDALKNKLGAPDKKISPSDTVFDAINSDRYERDMNTQLSSSMGDLAAEDYSDLVKKGIVPVQNFRKSQESIQTPRATVESDNTSVSVEDMFINKFTTEENNNILNLSNIEQNNTFTAFEKEIAMSENPKYFMGDDTSSVYMDIDTKTGKDRPAEGYGVAKGDTVRTRKENNEALKIHINESKKDAKRIVGNKVFSQLPEKKQEVLIELIYQMGANRIQEFPNFLKAMVMGDFNLAANELLFTPSGEPTDWSQKGGRDRVKRIVNKLREV